MVEVELVQMAQATTSQTACSMGSQEAAGGKQSGTQRTKGKDTTPQIVTLEMPRAVMTKEATMRFPQYIPMHRVLQEEVEVVDPSCSVGQKDWPTLARWNTVPGTMFNGQPEVSFCQQETCTLESSEGSRIQNGWQNRDHGLDSKTNQGVSQSQNERMAGDSPEVPTGNDGLK